MDLESSAKDLQVSELPQDMEFKKAIGKPEPVGDITTVQTPQWDVAKLFGTKRLIRNIEVDTSTNGTIFSFTNTPRNVFDTFRNVDISNMFSLFKYKPKFTFEIESSFQHVGLMCLVLDLRATSEVWKIYGETGSGTDVIQNVHNFPHQYITMGHNGNYSIIMPWMSPYKMLSTNPTSQDDTAVYNKSIMYNYNMGTLKLNILDQLTVAVGVSPVFTVRIWMELVDLQFAGYLGHQQ